MSNNELFNWGNRTPEQDALQRRLEELALYEQAVNARTSQTGGVGGGSNLYQRRTQNPETALFLVREKNKTTYTYYVADFQRGTLLGPIDTGISYNDHYVDYSYGLQDKGYFFLFRLNSDSNDYKMLFLDRVGTRLSLVEGYTSDLSINYETGLWLIANDYDARHLWYFDGETVNSNSTYLQGTDGFSIGSVFDRATEEGFLLRSSDIDGGVKYSFVTNSGIRELFSRGPGLIADNSYLDSKSNAIVVEEFDTSIGRYTTLRIISLVTGNPIATLDLSDEAYNGRDAWQYGEGNYLWIFSNATEYFMINYRAASSSIETATIARNDYPNYYYTSDSFSNFDYNSYPIHNTFAINFYNQTGNFENNLTEVSACKTIYSVAGSSLKEYNYKNPGAGVALIDVNPRINKNTVALVTATDEYKIIALTSGVTYVHPLGIGISEYDGFGSFRTGEKNVFYFNLDTNDSAFFVLSANGASYTDTVLLGERINYYGIDWDVVVVQTSSKQWRLNTATNTLVEMPAFNQLFTTEPCTNPQLKEEGRIVQLLNGRIAYTHTQMTDPPVNTNSEAALEDFAMDGTVVAGTQFDFGASSSYFTNLYPGMFVLCAKNINLTSFTIDGNIGADGDGNVATDSFSTVVGGQRYTAYVKQVYDSSDPSIVHIIIVNGDGVGISQTVDPESDDDRHTLSGIPQSVNQLHYLLLSQANSFLIGEADLEQIIAAYLNIAHGKNIGTILSDLNLNYEDVTSIVETPFLFNDVFNTVGNDGPGSIDDGGDDMYDGANIITTNRTAAQMRIITSSGIKTSTLVGIPSIEVLENGKEMIGIVYADPRNNGKISVNIYDTSGVLKQYIKTPHFEYYGFDIVGTRATMTVMDKVFDGFNLYWNTTLYSIGLTSYKSKSYQSLDDVGFREREMNDTTWYD